MMYKQCFSFDFMATTVVVTVSCYRALLKKKKYVYVNQAVDLFTKGLNLPVIWHILTHVYIKTHVRNSDVQN